jgi:tetratricopeptide (TPR) repeat protein
MAWIVYQEGMEIEALKIMQKAAELESSTEKHPVTPGEILPARELLADMLFDMGRYRAAQTEYESALERSPNRFNSLYGAGLAAELGGSKNEAAFYYKKILEITANVKTDRERLKHVKFYLSQTVGSS